MRSTLVESLATDPHDPDEWVLNSLNRDWDFPADDIGVGRVEQQRFASRRYPLDTTGQRRVGRFQCRRRADITAHDLSDPILGPEAVISGPSISLMRTNLTDSSQWFVRGTQAIFLDDADENYCLTGCRTRRREVLCGPAGRHL